MFREGLEDFLTGTVNDANAWFSTGFAKVRCRPSQVEFDVEGDVPFVRVCGTICTQHGAICDNHVWARCCTVPS